MLADWRVSLDHHAPGVICGYVSHAAQFYGWAVAQGLAGSNPAALLAVPRRPRRLPRPIPTDDLMAALEGAPRRIRPWMVLGAWAGLRAKEVALLRAECLVLAGCPVLLVASDATKGIHERTVPLCDFAVAELRAAGIPRRGWVFGRADGQPGPNAPHTVSHLVNEYLRSLGIPATMHQLRHWFLTEAYQESGDLRLVQELAGHRDPATTAGYTAYSPGRAAEVVNAIPAPRRLLRAVAEQ
jgi:integrase